MGRINFNTAYQFDPATYGNQGAGGLLGMLQAMVQQNQAQAGADPGSSPTGENSYGSPQGGLLGRLAALQAQQSSYQPLSPTNGQAASVPQNANFRQVSSGPIAGWPPQVDPNSDRSGGSQDDGDISPAISSSNAEAVRFVSRNPPFGSQGPASRANNAVGAGVDPATQVAPTSGGLPGAYSDKVVPPQAAPAPSMKTAQIVVPVPRPGMPLPLPPIPMPSIPDWLKIAGEVLRLYTKRSSKKEGGDDDDLCYTRWDGEDKRCEKFYMPLPTGARWRNACKDNAGHRSRLCYRNGGTPDPEEPELFDWKHIPTDPAEREVPKP